MNNAEEKLMTFLDLWASMFISKRGFVVVIPKALEELEQIILSLKNNYGSGIEDILGEIKNLSGGNTLFSHDKFNTLVYRFMDENRLSLPSSGCQILDNINHLLQSKD